MYEVRALAGGVQVVLDGELGLESFTACVVLPVSSRDERPDEVGMSHLLEHLVMSAPASFDGVPFAEWVSEVGGQANASTSKETIAYWARVPAEAAVECIARLASAVGAPALDDELVTAEQRVVVQELLSAAADPVDQSTERFYQALFPDHPLGQPVGGRVEFLDFSLDQLLARHRRSLDSAAACVSLVGPTQLLTATLDVLDRGELGRRRHVGGRISRTPVPEGTAGRQLSVPPDADYAYVTVGGRGAARMDPLWAGFEVLGTAIGGLPGSMLYHRLRTELGVSYQVFSMVTPFSDCGAWRVLAGSTPDEVGRLEKVVHECLEEAAEYRLPAGAVDAARSQALGALLIDNEDPVARAHLNAYYAADGIVGHSPVAHARALLVGVGETKVAEAAARVLDTYTAVVAT